LEVINVTFTIVILAVSLSIDALGVGVAYGLRKVKIPLGSKVIICFFSILYSAAALFIGKSISGFLPAYVSKLVGIVILIFMGVWIIISAVLKRENGHASQEFPDTVSKTLFEFAIKSLGITIQVIKNPSRGDIDKSGTIDTVESLMLGLALSVDAIGVGIGSALAEFYSMIIPVSIGLFQILFIYLGTYLGEKLTYTAKINKKVLAVLPGILLIFLAIIRIY